MLKMTLKAYDSNQNLVQKYDMPFLPRSNSISLSQQSVQCIAKEVHPQPCISAVRGVVRRALAASENSSLLH